MALMLFMTLGAILTMIMLLIQALMDKDNEDEEDEK